MFKCAQGICVFTLAVTGLLAQTTTTTPTQETRTSGIAGIAQGQTARFNVLNPAPAASTAIPATTTAAACTAVLTYHDAVGAVLKTLTVTVAPGTAGYLDLFSDVDLALAIGQRRQIRATVTVPLGPISTTDTKVRPVCQLVGTLEIFESVTGRADVVLGGMHVVRNEDPTPVAASTGSGN